MGAFEARYTDQQREAVAYAINDRGIRPVRRVVELAAAGELAVEGEQLAPFEIIESSARDIARSAQRRRAGMIPSKLADRPAHDAIEQLRRRMVALVDRELRHHERKRSGTASAETTRQWVRVLRELAALPGADGSPARARPPEASPTRHGLAGAILRANRSPAPVQDDTTPQHEHESPHGDEPESDSVSEGVSVEGSGDPGEYVRERSAALMGDVVSVRSAPTSAPHHA